MVDLEAGRVVVRIDIALAVAELLRALVVGVAKLLRRAQVAVLAHVAGRSRERAHDRIRLRGPRQVDRSLRQIQLRLGQPHVLERLRRRDRDHERLRVSVAHVLRGEDDHPACDEARVLARLEHRDEVVDGRVGVGAAHRLDEGGGEVVVQVARAVVDERALAGGVGDVLLRQRGVLGVGGLGGEFEDVQRRARVASGRAGDQQGQLVRNGHVQHRRAPLHDDGDLLVRQRFERVELHPRHQRRVDLEVRVLGRGADQRHQPFLDRRQERVLLRLVEAVDLVEEQDRALPMGSEALAGACEHCAHLGHRGRDRRKLFERGAGPRGHDPRQRRLATSGRPVEHHRADPVLLDREPERRALAEHVSLADEFLERGRARALGERCRSGHPLVGCVGEQIGHGHEVCSARVQA